MSADEEDQGSEFWGKNQIEPGIPGVWQLDLRQVP